MRTVFLGIVVLALLAACEEKRQATVSEPAVAMVGDRSISRTELEERARPAMIEIERARYDALREVLDEMIGETLMAQEAAERGIGVTDLVEREIAQKSVSPTDEEVRELYDNNVEALGNAPFETLKPRLLAYMVEAREEERRKAFIEELTDKYPTRTALRPPTLEVELGGRAPRGGGPDAPVTIVEFADYGCPFCREAESTIRRVLNAYGDEVRLAYRDFPLQAGDSYLAAEATHCANDQGKAWEFHDKLMTSNDRSGESLKALAIEVGLDVAKFDDCTASGRYKTAVEKDLADAARAGVTGTPAFFINGRLLDGAQPFEKFQEVIEEELDWAKGRSRTG